MQSPVGVVSNLTVRGAVACGIGLALGVANPPLLPGVALMCFLIMTYNI